MERVIVGKKLCMRYSKCRWLWQLERSGWSQGVRQEKESAWETWDKKAIENKTNADVPPPSKKRIDINISREVRDGEEYTE